MSGDVPQGSLCTTNSVSSLIEELQYTLGEGPCIDSVFINSTGSCLSPIWPTRRCLGGSRSVRRPSRQGFVAYSGSRSRRLAGLGALNLSRDRPGELSTRNMLTLW